MTNLQKATDLISDILDLELGVGDIVREIHRPEPKIEILGILEYQVLLIKGNSVCVESSAFQSGIQWFDLKNVKLKQRNITLPMVNKCWELKYKNREIDWFNNNKYSVFISRWQLRKDNKDLSLFDQKNEKLYKFLIKVLGE